MQTGIETVREGEEFWLHVEVENARKAYSFETYLILPVEAFEFASGGSKPEIIKGDFLGDRADIFSDYAINPTNNTGTVTVGYSLAGQEPEKSGSGRLFSLRLRARAPGDHALLWAPNSAVLDANGEEQPKNFKEFVLRVEKENPDVNVVYIRVEREG